MVPDGHDGEGLLTTMFAKLLVAHRSDRDVRIQRINYCAHATLIVVRSPATRRLGSYCASSPSLYHSRPMANLQIRATRITTRAKVISHILFVPRYISHPRVDPPFTEAVTRTPIVRPLDSTRGTRVSCAFALPRSLIFFRRVPACINTTNNERSCLVCALHRCCSSTPSSVD
jgi:hypothetical protein